MEKIKHKPGYLKVKKEVEKFLQKSTVEYSVCAVTTKSLSNNKSFYCYSYDIANELANFLVQNRKFERFKVKNPTEEEKKVFIYLVFK